ncbi:MAG: hypothetical protein HUJ76_10190 [Parasporobacterium sp.]|nr:hypothetical protein [Parasporobacterium sp.]
MKSIRKILAAVMISALVLSLAAFAAYAGPAAGTQADTAGASTQSTDTAGKFTYVHDPRTNPKAMEDCIENPDAVYGFSPNPESTRLAEYASYDWTDKEFVEEARQNRIKYHEDIASLLDLARKLRDEGKSVEEIARAVSAERNRIRLESYKDDPEGLEKVKKSNLEKYGDENGPTADSLYEKKGSWEEVLLSAFNPNLGMDACCGLYDTYYQDYVELGLAEADPEPASVTETAVNPELVSVFEAETAAK